MKLKLPSLKMLKSVKITKEFMFVVIAFLAVILYANYGSCCGGFKPHNARSLGKPYSKFEAFGPKTQKESEGATGDNKESLSNIVDEVKKQIGLSTKSKETTEGFSTSSPVYPAPVGAANGNVLDVLGPLPANKDCIESSYGLSKSTGGICLDEKTKQLLVSRGGAIP
jgi:hypothetical protein